MNGKYYLCKPILAAQMKALFYIFIGGGIGSICRYLIQVSLSSNGNGKFPLSTFLANLTGCLLIGSFYSIAEHLHFSQETRLALTVGACGGFTTFSTFSNENLQLIRQGEYLLFFVYCTCSILLGIISVGCGYWIGNKLTV